jgi:hypothetical protein
MKDRAPELPKIHHIQVKLTPEEYEMFSRAAHAAMMDRTPYARDLFIAALKREQARLGLIAPTRKHG